MKKITFTVSGKKRDFSDIFVGEKVAGFTCVSCESYDNAHLHIDGSTMKKITYKLATSDYDILGFGDGTVIMVYKRCGDIDIKRFDIRKKEENVIKICEAYEAVILNIAGTKPAADLA